LAVSVFFDKTYFLPISLWTKFSSANTFEIDATIVNKKTQLETLDEYKKSLIFEYVTGKKKKSPPVELVFFSVFYIEKDQKRPIKSHIS